jgi:hypothetical protein
MLFNLKPDTQRTDGMRQWQGFLGDIESAKPVFAAAIRAEVPIGLSATHASGWPPVI